MSVRARPWARHRPPEASSALEAFVAGRRVVLVGPSGYLSGQGQGPAIDAHDVVVRVNLDCPIRPDLHERVYPGRPHPVPEDVGTRTDILYHVLYSNDHHVRLQRRHTRAEVAAWREDGVRYLVVRHEATQERVKRVIPLLDGLPLVVVPRAVRQQVRAASRANVNTGVLAIAHLLSMPVRSLHVTGFSFYQHGSYRVSYGGFDAEEASKGDGTGHWGQYPTHRMPHPQEPQLRYLQELWERDRRLSFDALPASLLGLGERPPAVTAIVPLKRHSERVPHKNVRELGGRPLYAHILETLQAAHRVDHVVVDTDSPEIAGMVHQASPRTQVTMLGEHVNANTILARVLPHLPGDHFLQTHATSPLLTPATVDRAVEAYFEAIERGYDSLVSVTRHQGWFFGADGTPLNPSEGLPRTQDLEPVYEANSAIQLFSRSSFAATGSRTGQRPLLWESPRLESVDIDTEDDWTVAAALMGVRHG